MPPPEKKLQLFLKMYWNIKNNSYICIGKQKQNTNKMEKHLTLNAKVNYTICNFYTGWKKEIHTGVIKSFHCPGWVTILSGNEVHYVQYKEIVAIVK